MTQKGGCVRLDKLVLRNFKGIKDFQLDANGEDINIYGSNSVGKTTLFDSFTWLLFDKDSLNRSTFDIKMLTASGEALHGLDHEVEGVLEIDGNRVALRKVYSEKWTKRKGFANKEFTGHTTSYYVNDVPVTKRDYESRIIDMVNDETAFKLLTNPRYFNEVLKRQERRDILLEVCGDISDEEVIAHDSELANLPAILGGRKFDDHRAMVIEQRTKVNKKLQEIPLRIDEVNRGLPGRDENREEVTAAFDELNAKQQERQREFITLNEGGAIAEKTKSLCEVESELIKFESEHWSTQGDVEWALIVERNKVKEEIEQYKALVTQKQSKVNENDLAIVEASKQMTTLRDEWHKVNIEEFTYDDSDTCPTCGQELPAEYVAAARENALAAFNRQNAETLESIECRGKQRKAKCEALVAETTELLQKIEEIGTKLEPLVAQALSLHEKIEVVKQRLVNCGALPEHDVLTEKKATIELALAALRQGNTGELDRLKEEIASYDTLISDKATILVQLDQRESGLQRIEELKGQEKTLAAEYERLEQEIYLTDQFVHSKVRALEGKVNGMFAFTKWKLFEELINGGTSEVCEATYGGVPYGSGLNNGARINVGMDIINTLSEHYGAHLPIWLDNAEAVTQIIESKGQQIRLYVSEEDPVLRVEKV